MSKKSNKIVEKVIQKSADPKIPQGLLNQVSQFLQARLKLLEKRKKEISKEDPFRDLSRIDDNAALDIEADEQSGHARISAIRKEIIRAKVQIRKALSRVKVGKYGICSDCGQMIDTDRLMVYPEATLCTKDAVKREKPRLR